MRKYKNIFITYNNKMMLSSSVRSDQEPCEKKKIKVRSIINDLDPSSLLISTLLNSASNGSRLGASRYISLVLIFNYNWYKCPEPFQHFSSNFRSPFNPTFCYMMYL